MSDLLKLFVELRRIPLPRRWCIRQEQEGPGCIKPSPPLEAYKARPLPLRGLRAPAGMSYRVKPRFDEAAVSASSTSMAPPPVTHLNAVGEQPDALGLKLL